MSPSIYDYRSGEIENARRIRRERIEEAVGLVLAVPLAVVLFVIALAL